MIHHVDRNMFNFYMGGFMDINTMEDVPVIFQAIQIHTVNVRNDFGKGIKANWCAFFFDKVIADFFHNADSFHMVGVTVGNGKMFHLGNILPVAGYRNIFGGIYQHLNIFNIQAWPQPFIPAAFFPRFPAQAAFAEGTGDNRHSAASDNF